MLLFTLKGIPFQKICRGRSEEQVHRENNNKIWDVEEDDGKREKKKQCVRKHTHTQHDEHYILWLMLFGLWYVHSCIGYCILYLLFICLFAVHPNGKCMFSHCRFGFASFADDDDDLDTNRLATAPRMGTSLRTAATAQSNQPLSSARPRTSTGRPLTGMVRPIGLMTRERY